MAATTVGGTAIGWTGVAIAAGTGLAFGAGFNAIRQHAEMADGTRDHFSWQDFVLSGLMGAAMAPGFAMFPWVTFPIASGMGIISGVCEATQGNGWTAATDIGTSLFPYVFRTVRIGVTSRVNLVEAHARSVRISKLGNGGRIVSPRTRLSAGPTAEIGMADETSFVRVYHKGELMGGKVRGHKPFSTGPNRSSVAGLNRPGPLHEYAIPRDVFNRWEFDGKLRYFTDWDAETGILNEEVRFDPSLSEELNRYKVP
jgi:hypothetical protein